MNDFALYTNPKGQPVTHSSYSSRSDFRKCPKYFELTRIDGWMDKENRAAPLFGKCIEAGIEYHEGLERAPGTAVAKFTALWEAVKTVPDFAQLVFTEKEKDWDQLLRAGREMMMLYEIRVPFLPISTKPNRALFQQVVRKKVFPGTEYDKLENKAILDILSFPSWNHPALPKILASDSVADSTATGTPWRSLIIDVKTSGMELDTTFVRLDPQLAEYAWMSRIPDIAFLWFVKKGHELKKGSKVSALEAESGSGVVPGFEYVVLTVDKEKNLAYMGGYPALAAYEKELAGTRGKARDEKESKWLAANIAKGEVYAVSPRTLTRQRIQFAAARLTQADMDEIGRDVAQTTIEMVRANKENYYPKLAGIRFPNQKCQFCAMRHICLGDSDARDKNLTRKGDEWLEESLEQSE
jgi:hypothetical protein